ncbi:MAG: LON peptidase substrate-binding domain-containing protein [Flavobacteriales bacterium]|nr:LON peptidase substrate-binding domain-containing protein [Flavobacteriales bacterium]NNK81382.1 LON peptidase substrate-binding domain-containing protein [Flavobacteriales bacterium]
MTLSEKIEIPLFPLSIFLLPGERIQLHIFEPRYRQLINDLENGDSKFGIPYTTGRMTRGLGARCKLIRVLKRYNTGESDVLIECEGIFELEDFQSMKSDKLYPYGSVRLLRDLNREIASEEVLEEYDRLRNNLIGTELHFHTVDSDGILSIMSTLNASSEEKYRFTKLSDSEARNTTLQSLIEILNSLVVQEKATEHGLYLS